MTEQRDKVIALVSAGPSYVRFAEADRGQYDIVIGVNEIATMIPVDWWAFNDWMSFAKWALPDPDAKGLAEIGHHGVIGSPSICTRRNIAAKLQEHLGSPTANAAGEHVGVKVGQEHIDLWESVKADRATLDHGDLGLPQEVVGLKGWNHKRTSGPPALALAVALGAKRVDCYGCDMAGREGINGRSGRRGEDRWEAERELWGAIVAWAASEGCDVRVVSATDSDQPAPEKPPTPALRPAQTAYPRVTPRRWRYRYDRRFGFRTAVFTAPNEQAMRELIARFHGKAKAEAAELMEVT